MTSTSSSTSASSSSSTSSTCGTPMVEWLSSTLVKDVTTTKPSCLEIQKREEAKREAELAQREELRIQWVAERAKRIAERHSAEQLFK